MLPRQRSSRSVFILGAVLLVILIVPVAIGAAFMPLIPPHLGATVTAYFPTEAAYQTAEVIAEFRATSVTELLPMDDFGNEPTIAPADLIGTITSQAATIEGMNSALTPAQPVSYRRVLLQATSDLLIATSAPPNTTVVTGSASADLPLYSCPSADSAQVGTLPTGTTFNVLGYGVDFLAADEAIYLLIDHRSPTEQVWVRHDETIITLSTPYRDVFTRGLSCGSDPARDPATGAIPLPAIATATLPPPVSEQIIITEQEAQTQIAANVAELREPVITINADGNIIINGVIDLPLPLGATLAGQVEIVGQLVQENTDLRMDVSRVVVAGRDITGDPEGQQVENAINGWLTQLLVQRDVTAFAVDEDVIVVQTMRYFGARPEVSASVETTPTTSSTPINTPTLVFATIVATPTNTLVVRVASPIPVVTSVPLTVSTATPGEPLALTPRSPMTPPPMDATNAPGSSAGAPRAITNDQATTNARTGLGVLSNPSVVFEDGQIRISGGAVGSLGPLGQAEVIAVATIINGKVELQGTTLVIAGQSVALGMIPGLEASIEAWLTSLIGGGTESGSVTAEDGVLSVIPSS